MTQALKFIALSGAGWLLDMALFAASVAWLHVPEGVANFCSATIAAMTVFFVSQKVVFDLERRPLGGALIYWIYTEANIVVWSILISLLAGMIAQLALLPDPAGPAIIAKLIVTPFSLALNFVVAKHLSRKTR